MSADAERFCSSVLARLFQKAWLAAALPCRILESFDQTAPYKQRFPLHSREPTRSANTSERTALGAFCSKM